MNNSRILITGCGGMLGSSLYPVFFQTGAQVLATDIDLNETWLQHLDIRDIHECEKVFEQFKPTIVLNCTWKDCLQEYSKIFLDDYNAKV